MLDPMDYSSNPEATWDSYHSPMGRIVIQRLFDALSIAAPRKFPNFQNWRHVPINVPLQKCINDSGMFAMKFMEFYDGEGHCHVNTTIDPVRKVPPAFVQNLLFAFFLICLSMELRAEMLQYLSFHMANKVHPIDELRQFRLDQLHPQFNCYFY